MERQMKDVCERLTEKNARKVVVGNYTGTSREGQSPSPDRKSNPVTPEYERRVQTTQLQRSVYL